MKKLTYIFFLILPFIDLITALSTRFNWFPVSIGVVIKSIYLLLLTIYIFFISKSKHRKKYIYSFILVLIYALFFFVTKTYLFDISPFIKEAIPLFKIVYGTLIFFAFLVLLDDFKYEEKDIIRLMFYSLIAFTLMLIIPIITGTNFNSYVTHGNAGSVGWFYSANEIGPLMLMLFPFLFIYVEKFNKNKFYYLLLIPVIYAIFALGTKASWFGLIAIILFTLIIYLLKREKINKIIIILITLLSVIVLSFVSPSLSNFNKNVKRANTVIKTTTKTTSTTTNSLCKSHNISKLIDNKIIVKGINALLSGRENKAYTFSLIYINSDSVDQLFGLGYTFNKKHDCYINRFIEIDVLDALFHYGIFGLLILLLPFIYIIYLIIRNGILLNKNNLIYIIVTIILIGASSIAGHIIGYPTPNIFLDLYLILIALNLKKKIV